MGKGTNSNSPNAPRVSSRFVFYVFISFLFRFIFEFADKKLDEGKLYFIYNLSNFVRLLAALVSILLYNMLVGGIYEFSKI